ncbi:MAG: hypothetical protein GY797_28840 [Deltaproteobacteria bacterium]|nr:hypothetical protein [Deltaproteobacteria bacterium]
MEYQKFQMELPMNIGTLVDQIRENDPLKPSRRQQYTKIVMEWLEWKGYLESERKKESERERKKRLLEEDYRRKMAEFE